MMIPEAQPEQSRRRRRWFQYSLRTLLVVMLLASIAMSWFAVKLQRARRQREAVKAIENLGGIVKYDRPWRQLADPPWLWKLLGVDFFASAVDVLFTSDAVITDADLEHLKGLTRLQGLNLGCMKIANTRVTDAGLEHLKGLTQLKTLNLSDTRITDAGLEHLKGLTQLQVLVLQRTKVTGAGLGHLNGLPQLQTLALNRAQITDAGLEALKGLTQVQYVDLDGTRVTDAGLEHLKGLTQLQELELEGTEVTYEGVEKLREALPNCTIHNSLWIYRHQPGTLY